jgi:hypothetical protein
MKRSITTAELKKIIELMPKKKIEKNRSWGDCLVDYDDFIDPYSLLYRVDEYLKEKQITKLIIKNTKSF